MLILAFLVFTWICVVRSQLAGTLQAEVHPPLTISMCTQGGCSSTQASVVLDSNWRWTHMNGVATNCFTGNNWNMTICPDPITCATTCAIEGVSYQETYGITTNGDSLRLNFVTKGQYDTNVGSRVYLMADQLHYQKFNLLGNEFTFDVDVSQLPCGLNGALYFVEMAADGGLSQFPYNKAGAQYGTGYCDAQCPQDLKWIDGVANVIGWNPSGKDPNGGSGEFGNCCHELDIWEANSIDTAVTAHVCRTTGQVKCNGTTGCGDIGPNRYVGQCDRDGCDYNTYRLGNQTFYGPSNSVIDTNQIVTVTTQFITDNSGQNLAEIRRSYIQNGKVIKQARSTYPVLSKYDSITQQFCDSEKALFQDSNRFKQLGGLTEMGKSMKNGMVLVMSLWDDYAEHMLWLDSSYPTNRNPSSPGVSRGPCSTSSGDPQYLQSTYPNAYVVYSNIKFGPIGSTTDL